MIYRNIFAPVVLLSLVLVACGPGGAPESTGDSEGTAAEAAVDINALMANADLKRGETLFLQCRACHSLAAGEPNKVGPNLHGMFGRKAGLAPDFVYSDPMAQSEVIWDPESLSAFLERPSQFMPGNRMVFIGVGKPVDRANLIAFLQQATSAN